MRRRSMTRAAPKSLTGWPSSTWAWPAFLWASAIAFTGGSRVA